MKKAFIIFFSVLLVLTSCFQAFAEDEWTCPSCGSTVTGNFCSVCGEKRPEENGNWICPNCGAECSDNFCSNCGTKRTGSEVQKSSNEESVRLDLEIAFEKNAYFSTYDVKLFVDDEWIATMRHGVDYADSIQVAPGKHVIKFQEDSSFYPSEGSTIINIGESTLYKCSIHAKNDTIQISDERTEFISENRAAPDKESAIKIDGDLKLSVSIEFKKNGIFSQYDVDMYFDDTFIETLPHGKDYENTLLVSKGNHMITFYKSGSKSVRGTCSFKVEKDGSFSCKIEAERNKVDISKDKMSY